MSQKLKEKNLDQRKLSKLRKYLIIIALIIAFIVGLGLTFNQQIRDIVLQHNSDSAMRMIKKNTDPRKSKIAKKNKSLDELKREYAEALKRGDLALAKKLAAEIKKKQGGSYDWSKVKPMSTGQAINAATHSHEDGMGAIAIPSVGMYLPIVAGVSNESLSVGGGTFWEAQSMKYSNNYPLAGHALSPYGKLFSKIADTSIGEYIFTTDFNNIYTYRIYENTNIEPTDTGVVNMDTTHNGHRIITLLSCSFGGEKRTLVRGDLVKVQPSTKKLLRIFQNIWY